MRLLCVSLIVSICSFASLHAQVTYDSCTGSVDSYSGCLLLLNGNSYPAEDSATLAFNVPNMLWTRTAKSSVTQNGGDDRLSTTSYAAAEATDHLLNAKTWTDWQVTNYLKTNGGISTTQCNSTPTVSAYHKTGNIYQNYKIKYKFTVTGSAPSTSAYTHFSAYSGAATSVGGNNLNIFYLGGTTWRVYGQLRNSTNTGYTTIETTIQNGETYTAYGYIYVPANFTWFIRSVSNDNADPQDKALIFNNEQPGGVDTTKTGTVGSDVTYTMYYNWP